MKLCINDIARKLNLSQYKLTPQREMILRVLSENSDRHLSAEELYGLVKKITPEVGLATIYRTLEILVELNILHKIDFGDGRSRFEFASQERHRHHHLICLRCGSIAEAKDDLLQHLEETIERENSFKVIDHSVKLYGYCARCQQEIGKQ